VRNLGIQSEENGSEEEEEHPGVTSRASWREVGVRRKKSTRVFLGAVRWGVPIFALENN
jgi:hypothetical protein